MLEAGRVLLETGTPYDQLRVADAVELASRLGPSPLTSGAVYPRFGTQNEFRLAVLSSLEPRYRDLTFTKLHELFQNFYEQTPFTEQTIPQLLIQLATARQRQMGSDRELALRMYAQSRIVQDPEGGEHIDRLRERVRERDAVASRQLAELIAWIAEDVGAVPHTDLSYADFEVAVSCLATGLALRQQVADPPLADDLYARLVAALTVGFFQPRAQRMSVFGRLTQLVKRLEHRRKRFDLTLERLHEAARQEQQEQNDAQVALPSEDEVGKPVRRALEAALRGGTVANKS